MINNKQSRLIQQSNHDIIGITESGRGKPSMHDNSSSLFGEDEISPNYNKYRQSSRSNKESQKSPIIQSKRVEPLSANNQPLMRKTQDKNESVGAGSKRLNHSKTRENNVNNKASNQQCTQFHMGSQIKSSTIQDSPRKRSKTSRNNKYDSPDKNSFSPQKYNEYHSKDDISSGKITLSPGRLSPSKREPSLIDRIPLSQTEIVGTQSCTSLMNNTSFVNQFQNQKHVINRLGLSLRPVCRIHKHQKQKYICLDVDCFDNQRVICEECMNSLNHSSHQVKTIEEYLVLLEKSYDTFIRKQYYYKDIAHQLEHPAFLNDIFKSIYDLKMSLCTKLDQMRENISQMCMAQLQTGNDAKGSPINYFEKQKDEIERMQVIRAFYDDIMSKNFFELGKKELNLSLALINKDQFVQIETIHKQFSTSYQNKEEQYLKYFNEFSQKFESGLSTLFKECKLEIPPSKIEDPVDAATKEIRTKEKQLEELENDVCMKRKKMKTLFKDLQELLKVDKKKSKQPNKSNITNNFIYNSYVTVCSHLKEQDITSNTVPIFECCQQAYQCVQCHYQYSKHMPKITTPSKRYCMKCLAIFKVSYPTDLPINCNECLS